MCQVGNKITISDVYEQADDVLRYSGFKRNGDTYHSADGKKISVNLSMNDGEVLAEIDMRECIDMVGYIDQFETVREARNFFLYLSAEIKLKEREHSLLTRVRSFTKLFRTVLHMRRWF